MQINYSVLFDLGFRSARKCQQDNDGIELPTRRGKKNVPKDVYLIFHISGEKNAR